MRGGISRREKCAIGVAESLGGALGLGAAVNLTGSSSAGTYVGGIIAGMVVVRAVIESPDLIAKAKEAIGDKIDTYRASHQKPASDGFDAEETPQI